MFVKDWDYRGKIISFKTVIVKYIQTKFAKYILVGNKPATEKPAKSPGVDTKSDEFEE